MIRSYGQFSFSFLLPADVRDRSLLFPCFSPLLHSPIHSEFFAFQWAQSQKMIIFQCVKCIFIRDSRILMHICAFTMKFCIFSE